jgi:hypothetical protein
MHRVPGRGRSTALTPDEVTIVLVRYQAGERASARWPARRVSRMRPSVVCWLRLPRIVYRWPRPDHGWQARRGTRPHDPALGLPGGRTCVAGEVEALPGQSRSLRHWKPPDGGRTTPHGRGGVWRQPRDAAVAGAAGGFADRPDHDCHSTTSQRTATPITRTRSILCPYDSRGCGGERAASGSGECPLDRTEVWRLARDYPSYPRPALGPLPLPDSWLMAGTVLDACQTDDHSPVVSGAPHARWFACVCRTRPWARTIRAPACKALKSSATRSAAVGKRRRATCARGRP